MERARVNGALEVLRNPLTVHADHAYREIPVLDSRLWGVDLDPLGFLTD